MILESFSHPGADKCLVMSWSGGYLDVDYGNDGLGFVEVSGHSVDRLWHIVQHQVQIDLILLWNTRKQQRRSSTRIPPFT